MVTFTVSTTNDIVDGNYSPGQLSLREAVNLANGTTAADTIVFASGLEGTTLTLTGGELVLRQDVTIDGDQNNDGTEVTLSGGDVQRILRTSGAGTDVALHDLTAGREPAWTLGGYAVTPAGAGSRRSTGHARPAQRRLEVLLREEFAAELRLAAHRALAIPRSTSTAVLAAGIGAQVFRSDGPHLTTVAADRSSPATSLPLESSRVVCRRSQKCEKSHRQVARFEFAVRMRLRHPSNVRNMINNILTAETAGED